jgi:hypothetical protein
MNESEYQRKFIEVVDTSYTQLPWLEGSLFFREVPLRYEIGKTKPEKDGFMPDTFADFIELDKKGRLHLWEAKLLWADDFQKGKVVGQLLFYDWLFQTDEQRTWLDVKPCVDVESTIRTRLQSTELRFHSWNVLDCGGKGWELAAGVNPHAWTYTAVNESYLRDEAPCLAVYHMFHTQVGFAIRNLWQLSINQPKHMHVDSLISYVDEGYELPDANDDQEDIPDHLFLKFIGRT